MPAAGSFYGNFYFVNIRMRSSQGLKLFSGGSPPGAPNGIWAISRHAAGRSRSFTHLFVH